MITAIDGYELKCEECGRKRVDVGFDIQMMYMWANQYGACIRLWCWCCGATHDVTVKKNEEGYKAKKHTMRCSVLDKYK